MTGRDFGGVFGKAGHPVDVDDASFGTDCGDDGDVDGADDFVTLLVVPSIDSVILDALESSEVFVVLAEVSCLLLVKDTDSVKVSGCSLVEDDDFANTVAGFVFWSDLSDFCSIGGGLAEDADLVESEDTPRCFLGRGNLRAVCFAT